MHSIDGVRTTESNRDFALWKSFNPLDKEVVWDSQFGRGRPGWHIECSAMCYKHLGTTIDIHAGGVDLVFPHHENEIAQSEAFRWDVRHLLSLLHQCIRPLHIPYWPLTQPNTSPTNTFVFALRSFNPPAPTHYSSNIIPLTSSNVIPLTYCLAVSRFVDIGSTTVSSTSTTKKCPKVWRISRLYETLHKRPLTPEHFVFWSWPLNTGELTPSDLFCMSQHPPIFSFEMTNSSTLYLPWTTRPARADPSNTRYTHPHHSHTDNRWISIRTH